MPQVHAYIEKEIANRLKKDAESEGISTSQAIARLISREYGGDWPQDFRKRFYGSWKGEPPARPPQDIFPIRDAFK